MGVRCLNSFEDLGLGAYIYTSQPFQGWEIDKVLHLHVTKYCTGATPCPSPPIPFIRTSHHQMLLIHISSIGNFHRQIQLRLEFKQENIHPSGKHVPPCLSEPEQLYDYKAGDTPHLCKLQLCGKFVHLAVDTFPCSLKAVAVEGIRHDYTRPHKPLCQQQL